MMSTSRKPRVVSRPTPWALRSMTTLEPSVVPCTAWLSSAHDTPARSISSSRPARQAAAGSGWVVSRLPVVSSPDGACSTKSVKVPPTSNPTRNATRSAPVLVAGETDLVGIAPARLVRQRVLDGLAAGGEVGALEEQQRGAGAELEQLGHRARRQGGVDRLLQELDRHGQVPLDERDEGLRQVVVGQRLTDGRRQPRRGVLERPAGAVADAADAVAVRA